MVLHNRASGPRPPQPPQSPQRTHGVAHHRMALNRSHNLSRHLISTIIVSSPRSSRQIRKNSAGPIRIVVLYLMPTLDMATEEAEAEVGAGGVEEGAEAHMQQQPRLRLPPTQT